MDAETDLVDGDTLKLRRLSTMEMADSSLGIDRRFKRRVYAGAGASEYWIIDLTCNVVHVHRAPLGDTYAQVNTLGLADALNVAASPGVSIEVASLFH